MRPDSLLGKHVTRSIEIVELIGKFSDETCVAEFAKQYIELTPQAENTPRHISLKQGIFTPQDILILFAIRKEVVETPIDANLISIILNRMKLYGIILDSGFSIANEYTLCSDCYNKHKGSDLLDCVVFGRRYSINKYKHAIPFITVTSKDDNEHIGSGIVFEQADRLLLVTNRHVIEGMNIKEIRAESVEYSVISTPKLCDYADLAIVEVLTDSEINTPILSATNPKEMESVTALGYPLISQATEPCLTKHSGEVNGSITTYSKNELMVISCHVNPGNSGGPLINEIGVCVGLVAQSNCGKYKSENDTNYTTTYNMAIPPSEILKFIIQNSVASMVQP